MSPRVKSAGEVFYGACDLFVQRCLRDLTTLFTPDREIWTEAVTSELYEEFVLNPDVSSADFIAKLRGQLDGASDGAVQLAAELVYVLLLPQEFDPNARRAHVQAILDLMAKPVALPAELSAALDGSFADYGAALMRRFEQYSFLIEFSRAWVVLEVGRRTELLSDHTLFREFIETLPKKGASSQLEALLHIVFPDDCEPIVSVEVKRKIAKAFSSYVEDSTAELDVQLASIRRALQPEYGEDFQFYEPELRSKWDGGAPPEVGDGAWAEFLHWAERLYTYPSFDKEEREYKLTIAENMDAAKTALEDDASDWLSKLRRAFGPPNNLTSWRAHSSFLDWCDSNRAEAGEFLREIWSQEALDAKSVSRFVAGWPSSDNSPGNRLAILSVLFLAVDPLEYPPFRVTPFEHAARLIEISPPSREPYEPGDELRPEDVASLLGVPGRRIRGYLRDAFPRDPQLKGSHWPPLTQEQLDAVFARFGTPSRELVDDSGRRYVGFLDLLDDFMVQMGERGVPLRDRLDAQSLMWWITSADPPEDWEAEERDAFLAYQRGTAEPPRPSPVPSGVAIPPVTQKFAQEMFLTRDWLGDIVDLLNEKRQVIFYGPPGTGKTYVALQLGEHVEAAGGQARLVQFHPAYSYEDFFEGYRPIDSDGDGSVRFTLRKGPLRRLADEAHESPEIPFLLIVDEINRGNLGKVFGELYFLLEYRDWAIRLQYSPDEEFRLPENLFVIGTMNTADRSIALVDSALRRRFYFVPFMPREEPIRSVLRKWLAENGYDPEPAQLLEALNAALRDAPGMDDEFAIGPSFFMTRGQPDVERIWEHAIAPLLGERFYGAKRADDIEEEFGIQALRARLLGDTEDESEGADAAEIESASDK